jgi:GT2 family glycosyltransferase
MRRTDLPGEKLMDERYPIYFNDVALARSLSATGRSLWMTPDSVVEHEHGASTRLLGGALRRQYIGALVLYMKATDTFLHLAFLRALVFAQGLASLVLRRPGALPLRDLVAALRGDPGPLPQAPSRLVAS